MNNRLHHYACRKACAADSPGVLLVEEAGEILESHILTGTRT
jgi:hypothetical protein